MIEHGFGTHAGLRREHNEDTYFADPALGLWLVADGMGGHDHGEVASGIARDMVVQEVRKGHGLVEAIRNADAEIMRQSNERRSERPMGTTVVALQMRDNRFEVAWVGDSRIYLFESGTLKQVSRDHSYVQELVDQGAISPAQARVSPHRNVVTQALGVTHPDQLRVESVSGELGPDSQLLLCSDGLTEEVEDHVIAQVLGEQLPTAQEAVEKLISEANRNGGSDNITVLLVRCRRA